MNKDFSGLHTALVTPFNYDKSIDYKSLAGLIEEQIEYADGIVVLGTTGESPTIDDSEFRKILDLAVKTAKGYAKIIVGTGSNNTVSTQNKSKLAEDLGADGILCVNPYYNKPTQEGMYQHFSCVAESVNIPVILYNIKGRTAVNLETNTLNRLLVHKNIVGIKEASGDLIQIMDVINNTDSSFHIMSGDDSLTYPIMCLGGHGVISVISNIFPRHMKDMITNINARDFNAAKSIHYKLHDLMKILLSVSSNPIPVKTILSHLGKIKEEFRLPLCKLSTNQKDILIKSYEQHSNE